MSQNDPPAALPELESALAHEGFVRAMAVGVLGGDAEVDDVVQETWLVAMRSAPREPGRLRSWLGGVARRLALSSRRGAVRRARRHAAAPRREGPPSPDAVAAQADAHRGLVAAVLSLDEPYRGALLLRYFEDRSVRDVARILAVPLDTAKTRLRRGLALLRERLDAAHGGDRRRWAMALAPSILGAIPSVVIPLVAAAAVALVGVGLGVRALAPPANPPPPDGKPVASADARSTSGDAKPVADQPLLAAAPADPRAFAGTGTIVGRVEADGKPVAGAEVEVRAPADPDDPRRSLDFFGSRSRVPSTSFDEVLVARATADADGRFVVAGLATGVYRLTARSERLFGSSGAWIAAAGSRVGTTIDVEEGRQSVAGRIRWADGRPAAGRVCLTSDAYFVSPEVGPVALDGEGRFHFDGVRDGEWRIAVALGDARIAMIDGIVVPTTGALEFSLPPIDDGHPVLVLSSAGGSPIPGASAMLRAATSGPSSRRAMVMWRASADAEGRLSVPASAAHGLAWAPGHSVEELDGAALRAGTPITLRRLAQIKGRVVGADGKPAAGVLVEGVPERSGGARQASSATTDGLGRFTLDDVPPGDVRLFARGAAGWAGPTTTLGADPLIVKVSADPADSGARADVEIRLSPPASVVGRVVDSKGLAVAGATVTVLTDPFSQERGPNRRRVDPVVTDSEGAFRIDALLPGVELRLSVDGPESAFTLASVTPSVDAPARVEVRLEPTHTLVVTAVDEGGSPLPGTRVEMSRQVNSQRHEGIATAMTNSQGRARLRRLPVGRLGLRATRRDVTFQKDGFIDVGAGPTTEMTLHGRRRPSIAGVVVDESNRPVEGASVVLNGPEGHPDVSDVGPVVTAADGRFSGLVGGEGEYDVVATVTSAAAAGATPRREARARVRSGTTDARLVLATKKPAPPTRVEVSVVDADGRPVPRAWLRKFTRLNGRIIPGSGGEVRDGRASSWSTESPEAIGDMWLEVSSAVDRDVVLPGAVTFVGPLSLRERTGTPIEIRLAPDKPVEGRVVGPDGAPVRGVVVTATPVRGDDWFERHSSDPYARDRTGADGGFRLRGLGGGRWRVAFEVADSFVRPEPIEAEGGTHDVEVRLRAGVSPTVTVVTWNDQPVANAGVWAWRADATQEDRANQRGLVRSGRTDASGRLRLLSLDPTVTLRLEVGNAFANDLPEDALPVVEPRWTPAGTTIRLPRGLSIAGHVVDAAGVAVPEANLTYMATENGGLGVRIEKDGAFRVGRLPAGDAVLWVEIGDIPHPGRSRRVVLRAGDLDAKIVVDRGTTLDVVIEDYDPNEKARVQALLTFRRGEWKIRRTAEPDREGRVHFFGLDAGATFDLYVRPTPDGRIVWRTGLKPGATARVRREPGLSIEGRARLPQGAVQTSVSVSDREIGWLAQGEIAADGTFRVVGVPPGRWNVSVSATVGDESYFGTTDADAGSTVEIDVKPWGRSPK